MTTPTPKSAELPDALRHASYLDGFFFVGDEVLTFRARQIAAELRRLHQSEAEGWRYASELEEERKRLYAENEALRAQAAPAVAVPSDAELTAAPAEEDREILVDMVAHLAGAASAYRIYAKRHPSHGKAETDAFFTTRVADMDKAVERGRQELKQREARNSK